jgi:hypothetical protein
MTESLDPALRRSVRRLRHRSRSVAVSVALIVAAVLAVYLGVEAALALAGLPALLATPEQIWDAAHSAPVITWSASVVLALIGVVCILLAVLPGGLARRTLDDDRLAVVIDDDVVASAFSREVAAATHVARDQVRTAVGRRRARVDLTPTTGFEPDREAARRAGADLVEALHLRPAPTPSVAIARKGVIG